MWGYGPDWGMMGPWGGYGGWGPIGMVIWIVILALVIAAVVWFVRAMTHPDHQLPMMGRRSPGLDVLEERYARGEIKRDECLEKKRAAVSAVEKVKEVTRAHSSSQSLH